MQGSKFKHLLKVRFKKARHNLMMKKKQPDYDFKLKLTYSLQIVYMKIQRNSYNFSTQKIKQRNA